MTDMHLTGDRPDVALPLDVQAAIAEHIGEVVRATDAEAGFTPGVKYLAETSNGGFYFIKSAPGESWMAHDYEVEGKPERLCTAQLVQGEACARWLAARLDA